MVSRAVWRSGATPRRSPGAPLADLPAPLAEFLHLEAAGGVVLVVATAVALVWANSPWQDSYHTLWSTHLDISLGSPLARPRRCRTG